MHLSRPIALTGAAFATIALLLPFARFPVIGAVDGFGADAWPALVALAPAAAAAMLGDWRDGSRPIPGSLFLISACVGLVFAVVKVADSMLAVRDVAGASFGAGSPVLVGGAIMAVVGAALALRTPTA